MPNCNMIVNVLNVSRSAGLTFIPANIIHLQMQKPEMPLQCKKCFRKFADENTVASHWLTHSGEQYVAGPDEKYHVCEICGKMFMYNSHLLYHLRGHSAEKPPERELLSGYYARKSFPSRAGSTGSTPGEGDNLKSPSWDQQECHVCFKKYASKAGLSRHLLSHTGSIIHQCRFCLKTFAQKSALSMHLLVHTQERRHQCHTCLKKFARKGDLVKHYLIHQSARPHKCDVCFVSFKRKADLSKHSFIHTGVRPYGCPTCSRRFTRRADLKKHLRTHSEPYDCSTCSKKFMARDAFMDHLIDHTVVKPHECELCFRTFIKKIDLAAHMVTHTSKTPN